MQDHERKALKAINAIHDGFKPAGHRGKEEIAFTHPLLGVVVVPCSPRSKENAIQTARQKVRKLIREKDAHVTAFLKEQCDIFGVGDWESKSIQMNLTKAVEQYIARSGEILDAAKLTRQLRATDRLTVTRAARGPGNRDSTWILRGKFAVTEHPEVTVKPLEPEEAPAPVDPEPTAVDPVIIPKGGDLIAAIRNLVAEDAERTVAEHSERMALAETMLREVLVVIDGLNETLVQANNEMARVREEVKGVTDLLSSAPVV